MSIGMAVKTGCADQKRELIETLEQAAKQSSNLDLWVNGDHKCHEEATRLNPWIEVCPICGCLNENFDPDEKPPQWVEDFMKVKR